MLTVRPVLPGAKVVLGAAPPALPPAALSRIEEIWSAEKQRRKETLFNGPLFSVATADPDGVVGWLAEYKWFLAQRRDPSLGRILRVCPLAVTGLLVCADGVVFGRRADDVEQDAGLWELVPSGGIDGSASRPDGSIDMVQNLLTELAEETGITASMIASPPQPIALIHDSETNVWDVGFAIRTQASESAVIALFASLENREYTELDVVPVSDLPRFVRDRGPTLAPVSSALLKAAGILPQRA
jgi:hypothetical protein